MPHQKTSDALTPAQVVPPIPDVLKITPMGTMYFSFNKYVMSKRQWDALPEAEQDRMVSEIFQFYREVWGFPYVRKTEDTLVWKTGFHPVVDEEVRKEMAKTNMRDEEKFSEQARRLRAFQSAKLLVSYTEEDEYEGGGFFGFGADDGDEGEAGDARHLKQNLTGMGVANAFMPHLHHTPVKGLMSPYDGFWDDKKLEKAIRLALRWDSGALPRSIRYGLRSIAGIQSVGNFKPTVSKFLYERYTPDQGGIVFDFSCGWGGRLTGARSSKKDIMYVGVDPSVKTFACLQDLDAYLCDIWGYSPGEVTDYEVVPGKVVPQYRSDLVRITMCGSEEFCAEDLQGKVDFAFSSPPYFDLEDYASGDAGYENQSHVKFPGRDGWLHGFLKLTAANVFKMLKPGGTCGLNLADFRDIKVTAEACDVFESVGFKYMPDENFEMRISVRTGNRSKASKEGRKHKTESIFIFRKPE